MIPGIQKPGKKHVLICPLDWGLGHASRMIPVISRMISDGHRVTIGGSGDSGELLKLTFPDLSFFSIPSLTIRYKGQGTGLIFSLFTQVPAMILSAFREHLLLKKVVRRYAVNVVISDNRYGLYCRGTYNIFVTHQISPVLPRFYKWAEYPLYLIIRNRIKRFHECWIPDFAGKNNLTGNLSHRYTLPKNAKFIGLLSRFDEVFVYPGETEIEKYNLVVVMSGPQPQLNSITGIVVGQAHQLATKILIITGLQVSPVMNTQREGLKIVPHLPPAEFKSALLKADRIVCRSGYSGIMDLVTLGKSAVLVPTPGQPEQEYLAAYLSKKGIFTFVKQSELDLMNLV